MKRTNLLVVVLVLAALCIGMLSGCDKEWKVYTGEVEGGSLYSLEEIYEARAIRRRDFLNIAYYNGDTERNEEALRNFEPEPFEELSEEISLKMRECMTEEYRNNGTAPEATVENIFVKKYLGYYNGYYAVRFSDNLFDYPDVDLGPDAYVYEVGGHKI